MTANILRVAAAVLVLAAAGGAVRAGAVGGPKVNRDVVAANATDRYEVAFRADEVGKVAVGGSGATRLDVYVYDENGNLITSAVGPGDDCQCTFVPKWTGRFVILVVNRGDVANPYIIRTN